MPPAEHPVAPLGPGHRNRRRARAQGARLLEHGRRRLRARRDRRARPLAPLRDRGLCEFRPAPNVYRQRAGSPRSRTAPTDAGLDPDQYLTEGDLLQTYYWRRWRGSRPRVLNAAWNFRGYKCSYADVGDVSRVRVVHKEERRAITLIFDACEHVRAPPRGARPSFLEELVSALDVGACRSPAAAAALRRNCPDPSQRGVG